MIPKYLRKKNIKRDSLRKEKWIAKNLIVPASGALWHSKGDFKTDKYLIEAKSGKKETKVKEEHLRKIFIEASRISKIPLMYFVFDNYYLLGEVFRINQKRKNNNV